MRYLKTKTMAKFKIKSENQDGYIHTVSEADTLDGATAEVKHYNTCFPTCTHFYEEV